MYHIILNPSSRSGRGMKIWLKQIEPILKERGIKYELYMTKGDDKNAPMVQEIMSKYDGTERINLIVLGGDGTVNEVVQAIDDYDKVQLSIIPTGSSNDLARDIGISVDPADALRHLLDEPTSIDMDLGVVHYENSLVRNGNMSIPDRYFMVSTGIGFDAAVCEEAMHSKLKNALNRCGLGKLTYLSVALKQLIATKYITGELILDGDEDNIISLEKLLFVAGMNHRFEGGGFMFGPEADATDGLIDMCVVSKLPKPKILRVLPSAFKGKHFAFDGVDSYRASSYAIRTSEPLWVHTDGEVKTRADYVSVMLKGGAVHFTY
ncbi:MAG: YegS/Rv2252/BmrU family lipid kinase [Lachnospiraceae bacterium]|nr:YegS/Rv2252/BmrU family lipid kinase [Candidatus Colinaster equi]